MGTFGKKLAACATTASLILGCAALAACSPATPEESSSSSTTTASYASDSMMGQHEARGTDITNLTEVSAESCTGSGCHGGSYASVREKTEGYWEGVGQIGEANPHDGHGSSGYACENCHSLSEGASVNQCNGCHNFKSPEGWTDKPADTTQYGVVNDEALY